MPGRGPSTLLSHDVWYDASIQHQVKLQSLTTKLHGKLFYAYSHEHRGNSMHQDHTRLDNTDLDASLVNSCDNPSLDLANI